MANEWCALCCKAIRAKGLTFKDEMPNRTVHVIGGLPVCLDHLDEGIELNLNQVEAERIVTTKEEVL